MHVFLAAAREMGQGFCRVAGIPPSKTIGEADQHESLATRLGCIRVDCLLDVRALRVALRVRRLLSGRAVPRDPRLTALDSAAHARGNVWKSRGQPTVLPFSGCLWRALEGTCQHGRRANRRSPKSGRFGTNSERLIMLKLGRVCNPIYFAVLTIYEKHWFSNDFLTL